MKLPYSYHGITVKQYQEIHPFLKDEMELDDWVKIISILSGLTVAEVETIPIQKLKNHLIQLSFLKNAMSNKVKKRIRVGKRFYKACLDAENLNTAQYTAIKTFCTNGQTVANLDKICSCIYLKLTWKGWNYDANNFKEASEDFSKVSIADVYGVVFFCSKALTYLMENTKDYLEAKRIIQEREQEIVDMMRGGTFSIFGDGMQQ